MGEYSCYDRGGYRYSLAAGRTCKACGKRAEDMDQVYIAILSRAKRNYSILCVPCFEKRQRKELGENVDDAVVNDGKKDYEIADIIKGCRHLLMKLRVENDQLALQVDKAAKKPEFHRDISPLASAIHDFPRTLTAIASGNLGDAGRYDKYRMALFIKLALKLRPFLQRITGKMIDRIYQRNRVELLDKSRERGNRHAWIEKRDSMPVRLYPVTEDYIKFANWLKRQMPPSVTRVYKEFSYWDTTTKKAVLGDLGVSDDVDSNWTSEVTVRVYNTSKGPRFVVLYKD